MKVGAMAEKGALPKRAGEAVISFEEVAFFTPGREGETIFLPPHPNGDFFSLREGTNFLFEDNEKGVWFGGTDENAFLVALEHEAIQIFKEGGEEGFYNALKPDSIAFWEKKTGLKAKRQGDIWAIRLPYSWKDITNVLAMVLRLEGDCSLDPAEVFGYEIFETRHRLTGKVIDIFHVFDDIGIDVLNFFKYDWPVLAQGVIEAEDHFPLKLNRIHLLAQTALLFEPDTAD